MGGRFRAANNWVVKDTGERWVKHKKMQNNDSARAEASHLNNEPKKGK